jgi:F-type H+-transporting ATPase subunit a
MSEAHHTILQSIGIPHEYNHVAGAAIVSAALIVVGLKVRADLRDLEKNILPKPGISLVNISTAIVGIFRNLLDEMIGHGAEKYVPLIGSIFLFILISNLSGLIPGFPPPTENVNTNFALGLISWAAFLAAGFREHGFGYLKSFTGGLPPHGVKGFLWAFLLCIAGGVFLIEILGQVFIRPVSLMLRLTGNINGDHILLGVFNNLTPLFVPIIFLLLGLLVCVIQALVFSLLSSVYLKLAVSHDH